MHSLLAAQQYRNTVGPLPTVPRRRAAAPAFRVVRQRRDRGPGRSRPPGAQSGDYQEGDDFEFDRLLTWPRMSAGLNIHRKVHSSAARNPPYLFQWRAFCERNKLDWQNASTDEDEGLLAGAEHGALNRYALCVRMQRGFRLTALPIGQQGSISSWRKASSASKRTPLLGVSTSGRKEGLHTISCHSFCVQNWERSDESTMDDGTEPDSLHLARPTNPAAFIRRKGFRQSERRGDQRASSMCSGTSSGGRASQTTSGPSRGGRPACSHKPHARV